MDYKHPKDSKVLKNPVDGGNAYIIGCISKIINLESTYIVRFMVLAVLWISHQTIRNDPGI